MHVLEKIAGLMPVRTDASGLFGLQPGKASLDSVQYMAVEESGEVGTANVTMSAAHGALHGVIAVGHAGSLSRFLYPRNTRQRLITPRFDETSSDSKHA
jgi:hypothetical protein